MRTRTLLGESDTDKFWFFTPEGGKSWSRKLRLWKLDNSTVAHRKALSADAYGRAGQANLALNVEVLTAANSTLSEKDAASLASDISSLLTNRDGERTLFSAYTINEFLNQDEVTRYGDFLDSHWDELYDRMKSYQFGDYPHTKRIFRLFNNRDSLLVHRPRSAAPLRKALEDLTIEELTKLSKMSERALKVKPDTLVARIRALINPEEKLPPVGPIKNQLFVAFARAVSTAGVTTKRSHFDQASDFIVSVDKMEKFLYTDPKVARADAIPSSALDKLSKLLMGHAEEFSPLGIAAIAHSVSFPELFTSSSRALARRFFVTVAQQEETRAVAVLKMLSVIATTWRGTLPSVPELESALAEGLFELELAPEAFFAMMGFTPRSSTRREMSDGAMDLVRGIISR